MRGRDLGMGRGEKRLSMDIARRVFEGLDSWLDGGV